MPPRGSNRSLLGTLWGLTNPPALVEVLGQVADSSEMIVRIVGAQDASLHRLHSDTLHLRAVEMLEDVVLPPDIVGVPGTLYRTTDHRYLFAAEMTPLGQRWVSDFPLEDLTASQEPLLLGERLSSHPPVSLDPYQHTAQVEVDVSPSVGDIYAWRGSSPAMIQVVELCSNAVMARILGTDTVESIPQDMFDRNTTAMLCRMCLGMEVDSLIPGTVLSLPGTVGVGESYEGATALYSDAPLDSTALTMYLEAQPVGPRPVSLGYPRHSDEALIEQQMPDEKSPETFSMGQMWHDGTRTLSVARVARDHAIAWLQNVHTKDVTSISSRVPPDWVYLGDFKMDDRQMWVHVPTRRRGEVVSYDEERRTALLRWVHGAEGEETVPVKALLEDYRCTAPSGWEKAVSVRDAPGPPAWTRLIKKRPQG